MPKLQGANIADMRAFRKQSVQPDVNMGLNNDHETRSGCVVLQSVQKPSTKVEARRLFGGWLPEGWEAGAARSGASAVESANLTRRSGASVPCGRRGPGWAPIGGSLSSTELSMFNRRAMTSGVMPSCVADAGSDTWLHVHMSMQAQTPLSPGCTINRLFLTVVLPLLTGSSAGYYGPGFRCVRGGQIA